ncbi:MAG TPA: GNAT family N-acetyltransferase [Allosphingosinicella sp.]|nr:GNAT family N-acetyltransferase [Allosphingosinicella sp.]
MTILRTGRLVLRPARPDDVDAFHAIMRDPRAMRYWSTPPHATLDQTREWVAAMAERSAGTCHDFVVELDGRAVGKAGCFKLPEIGYILHPGIWGQGYASEAMTAVIAHVFATSEIDALVADVDPRNEGSIGLLLRLGFAETHRAKGTWQVGDELCDSVYFALPRPRGGAE